MACIRDVIYLPSITRTTWNLATKVDLKFASWVSLETKVALKVPSRINVTVPRSLNFIAWYVIFSSIFVMCWR